MEKEKEQEIRKLVNVLRRMGRMASQAGWGLACGPEAQERTSKYCVEQYNRIYGRIKELDPAVGHTFAPLEEEAGLEVVAMACRQLAAYYEESFEGGEEQGAGRHRHKEWGSFYETAYEAGPFRIFFGRGFKDLEELGKLIRECMPPWIRGEDPRSRPKEKTHPSDSGPESDPGI